LRAILTITQPRKFVTRSTWAAISKARRTD
jgi:hypothetical protein